MGHKIKGDHYYGVDGFGDVPDPDAPGLDHLQKERAANAIVRLAQQYRGGHLVQTFFFIHDIT